jgi:hypothetical protein
VQPNYSTGVGPWPASWNAVYTGTQTLLTGDGTWNPSSTEGVLGGMFTIDSWATGYWGNLMPALSYAVRFGVSGASDAYGRLTGASNWQQLSSYFAAAPTWAVRPAPQGMPTWLQSVPVGQWVELADTKVSLFTDTWGTSNRGVLDDYSGVIIQPYESVVIMRGGGHAGYQGNEVLGINLRANAPAIYTLNEPTPVGSRTPTDGTAVWFGSLPNQKPNVPHTYDYGIYSARLGHAVWNGMVSVYGGAGGTLSSDMFSLKWSDKSWVQTNDGAYLGAGQGGLSLGMDKNGALYSAPGQTLRKYTPGSGWTTVVNDAALNWNGYGPLIYDSKRDRFLRLGDLITARYFTITSSGTVTNVAGSLSGSVSALNAVCSTGGQTGLYDPHNDRYLVPAGSGSTLYAIDPVTWVVSTISPTTVSGTVPNVAFPANGLNGRFKYVPGLMGAVYLPDGTANAWFLRLA